MKIEDIIPRIKKNKSLNHAEKKELIEFWQNYKCPVEGTTRLRATYYDGMVKDYTVEELDYWYDETPWFIERFFDAMAKGIEHNTRFATYKIVT